MPKKVRKGIVVSDKMDKTIVVAVQEKSSHPKYKKIQQRTVKFKAHDESNLTQKGQVVLIEECRPISRWKTWRLIKVLDSLTAAEG